MTVTSVTRRATQNSYLTNHIKSVHKRVKYDCNHCDYRATHIKLIHEGVNYDNNQCEYRAITQSNLTC